MTGISGGDKQVTEKSKVIVLEKRHSGSGIAGQGARITRLASRSEVTLLTVGRPRNIDSRIKVISFPAIKPRIASGLIFYGAAPVFAVVIAGLKRSRLIICKSPFEAFVVAWARRVLPSAIAPRISIEIHGDWRTAGRLYGTRLRSLLAPFADMVAVNSVRRADRIEVVSNFAAGLVRDAGYKGPIHRFFPDSHVNAFLNEPVRPLPAVPTVLFIGGLENIKGPDVLLQAWPLVLKAVPDGRLIMAVGKSLGKLRTDIATAGLTSSVRCVGEMEGPKVCETLDGSSLLVVPSRSEALPRVIVEAFSRGRAVVASNVGGIPELVTHRREGLLVPPNDPGKLAEALSKLLQDPRLSEEMGQAGLKTVKHLLQSVNPTVLAEPGSLAG